MRTRRAFTLLEAVLALAILSSALIVALQIRSSALAQTLDLETRLRVNHDLRAIAMLRESGALGFPEVDEQSAARTWRGEHNGEPFTIKATPMLVPSPIPRTPESELAESVPMLRFEITYMDQRSEFLSDR